MATTRDVSSMCWRHARPGTPVESVIEPAKPLILAEVWGPRKPGKTTQPSSSAAAAAAPTETEAPNRGQRCKAPPPYKEVQSAPAGPPPAANVAPAPGCTGACNEVAKGATSKSGQNKVPKKPPPGGVPAGWPKEVKAETKPLAVQPQSQPAARPP
eukprot:2935020-Amphidinium_carterae.1